MKKKLDYKVKQLKTNLQKYVHPSSLNQLIDAQVRCQETKKGSNFKEDDCAWGVFTLWVELN